MEVIIGSDHAGFSMKSQVKTVLEDMGHSVEDVGCHSEDSVDYPVTALLVCVQHCATIFTALF
jgi:ribose 5-phosphate isomerase B